jgi:hypothetical protein
MPPPTIKSGMIKDFVFKDNLPIESSVSLPTKAGFRYKKSRAG